jgi:hypothetical protein
MNKRWIVPLAGMLIAANFAFGQAQELPLPKTPPVPSAEPPPAAKPPDTPPGKAPDAPPAAKPPDTPPFKTPEVPAKPPDAPAAKTPDVPAAKPSDTPPAKAPDTMATIWPEMQSFLQGGAGSHGVLSAEAEYMLWFPKSTLGSFPLSPSATPGNVTIEDLDTKNNTIVTGGRFAFGYWMTEENAWVPEGIRTWGAEARFFFVGSRSSNLDSEMDPPTFYRPFFDLNNRTYTGFLIAEPGTATGTLSAHAENDFWGAEANVWKNVFYNTPGTIFAVNFMTGFRYLNSNTALEVSSNSVFAAAPLDPTYTSLAGNRLQVTDSFATHNNFYGGQVGIGITSWFEDHVNLEASLRVALGATSENLTINGGQVRTLPNGAIVNYSGGLLALPSNIGSYHLDKFTQVPEMDFKLNFPICSYLTLSTGFSALYWNRVLLSADQLDHNIDVSQLPNFPPGAGSTPTGLGRPAATLHQSDLWVLGISIGAEFRW